MSLVNNSANNFKDFLDAIKPFLNYQFYDLSGQGVEATNFSTDEKVIGTWVDGKPLYQKTIDCGALPNATGKIINHNISNIDKIISCDGIAIHTTSVYMSLPLVYDDNSRSSNTLVQVTKTNIRLEAKDDRSAYTSSYVTLRYTKTTDTAVASGEKIVGQWIDGKPVYEKTFTGLSIAIPNDNWASEVLTIPNGDKLVNIIMFFEDGGSTYIYTAKTSVIVSNKLNILGLDARTISTITLQYTKTN